MLNGKLLGEAFPINKVEVFFDAEDHSDFLGFQWEKVSQGRIPIGLDDSDTDFNTIGKTGGEKEVILTTDEIPYIEADVYDTLDNKLSTGWNAGSTNTNIIATTASENMGRTLKAKFNGGGQAHNNVPPYVVMAFWKRIA